jgi:hypothetical protein
VHRFARRANWHDNNQPTNFRVELCRQLYRILSVGFGSTIRAIADLAAITNAANGLREWNVSAPIPESTSGEYANHLVRLSTCQWTLGRTDEFHHPTTAELYGNAT